MLTGGESLGSWGRSAHRATLATLAALIIAAGLSACGSSETGPPSTLAPNNLIGHAELVKNPEGSVERTFLEYWSNLQFHSWADVAAYYDSKFRDYIGTAKLINAEKVGASSYPLLKPEIVRSSTGSGVTTVYYSLINEDGTRELASTTWRKVGGNWQMVYDSRLDAALSQVAQEKVALSEAPPGAAETEQPLSSKAIEAGRAAAQIQARFLQKELQLNRP